MLQVKKYISTLKRLEHNFYSAKRIIQEELQGSYLLIIIIIIKLQENARESSKDVEESVGLDKELAKF